MNRFVVHARPWLISAALTCWPCLGAHAEDAQPKQDEEQEPSEAPPQVLQIASPLAKPNGDAKAKADAAALGDTSDATPDNDLTDAIPGDPWGDAQGLNVIALRSLFQTRYVSTFAEDSTNSRASYRVREDNLVQQGDGYSIERLFMRMSSDPVKYVGFKAVLDFAELVSGDPEDLVKQAYSTISPMPGRIDMVVGLFKIPFSTPELDPSARFEFAELGPANRLMNDLGYTGRDYGVEIIGAPLPKARRLHLMFGIFRGHAYDEHDSPAGAIAGRIEAKPTKALRFGAGVVSHLKAVTYNRPFNTSDKDVLPDPPDPLYPAAKHWGRGQAYGIDTRYKKKGLMLRGEATYGDRVDVDRSYGATHFWSAWGIAAYSFNLGVVKLLPAFRAEWLDADAGHGKGLHRTLSGSFTVIAWSRVRFMVDATNTHVEPNTIVINQPKPLQADPYLALSNTRLTGQLQLEL
jgi:hypothetical protein